MKGMNRSTSDFLFARPSWLSGIARVFDFWGLYDRYNTSRSPRIADAKAVYSDWRAVGGDIWWAMDRYTFEDEL